MAVVAVAKIDGGPVLVGYIFRVDYIFVSFNYFNLEKDNVSRGCGK